MGNTLGAGVARRIPEGELDDADSQLVKLCTPDFVRELVKRASGMPLTHLLIPPPAISDPRGDSVRNQPYRTLLEPYAADPAGGVCAQRFPNPSFKSGSTRQLTYVPGRYPDQRISSSRMFHRHRSPARQPSGRNRCERVPHHMREALKTAASQALAAGYTADDQARHSQPSPSDESSAHSQNRFSNGCVSRCRPNSSAPIPRRGVLRHLQQLRGGIRDLGPDRNTLPVPAAGLRRTLQRRQSRGTRPDYEYDRREIRRIRGPGALSPGWQPPRKKRSRNPTLGEAGIIAVVAPP